jgi:hypothetical protein
MSTSNSNYKNTVKKLRKATSSLSYEKLHFRHENFYKYLTELEENEHENEYEKMEAEKISREKIIIEFNDLPEDAIYIILDFLPCNTRLSILKHKYHKSFIKNIIKKVPETLKGLNRIWKCADIANKLLDCMFDYPCDVLNNLNTYRIRLYKCDLYRENYSNLYKEAFTKIILTAIKHYSKIYKNINGNKILVYNKKVIEHTEKIILNIFAHLFAAN